VQRVAAFLPGGRIHPGIDAVGDGEVPWPAHQETRPRIKLPCVVIPCQESFFAQRVRLRRAMPKIGRNGRCGEITAARSLARALERHETPVQLTPRSLSNSSIVIVAASAWKVVLSHRKRRRL
jgi:hypothetical protein